MIFKLNHYKTIFLLLVFAGLATSEFVHLPQTTIRHQIKLSRAKEIPHEGIAYNNNKSVLSVFENSLDVDFGYTLTEKDFDSLRQTYSGWSVTKSRITYLEGRRYTLLDFLPPIMQATSSMRFRAQERSYGLPDFKSGSFNPQRNQSCQFLINCWGFAYDILYSSRIKTDRLHFTLASSTVAYNTFFDDSIFKTLQKTSGKSIGAEYFVDQIARNKYLSPGDTLLIWHQNEGDVPYLDHVAVFIDDDIYFEKAGTGDDVPFRLNDWAGLTKSWMPVVFNFNWVRLKEGVVLDSPFKLFGLQNPISLREIGQELSLLRPEVQRSFAVSPDTGADGKLQGQIYIWMKELDPFNFDEMGRAALERKAFIPKSLEIDIPANIYNRNFLDLGA